MTFATATVKSPCHLNERCAVSSYSFIGQVNKAQAAWISNKVEEKLHDVTTFIALSAMFG